MQWLTSLTVLPAHEGGVDVFQQDDALLGSHTEEVVEAVVGKPAIAEVQHTDAVLQLSSKGSADTEEA